MEIIRVITVQDSRVATVGPVAMDVIVVLLTVHLQTPPLQSLLVMRMFQGQIQQLDHMLISEPVIVVSVVSSSHHQVLPREDLEPIGGGGHSLAEVLRQTRDACLAGAQTLQKSQPLGGARRLEHRRGSFKHSD